MKTSENVGIETEFKKLVFMEKPCFVLEIFNFVYFKPLHQS